MAKENTTADLAPGNTYDRSVEGGPADVAGLSSLELPGHGNPSLVTRSSQNCPVRMTQHNLVVAKGRES